MPPSAAVVPARAPRGHVAMRKVQVVLALAEGLGLPRAALLTELGLDAATASDPDAWVPQGIWRHVWELVVARTGDEAVGVKAAQRVDPGYFGVIDYAARACADLGEAIPLAARYFRLANSWGHLDLRETPTGLRVSRHILGDEGRWLPPQAADFALTTMVRVMQLAASRPFALERVLFRRPAPPNPEPWQRFFACPVVFGAAEDAVDVPAAALSLPMRAPDPRLRALLTSHAAHLLAAVEAPDAPLSTQVRQQIASALASRRLADVDSVARRLGLSGRTLQRRLAEEQTSFRPILDGVRAELAQGWLRGGLSPGEVAFLLGYSELSAFTRAFAGWTGQPPASWARAGA